MGGGRPGGDGARPGIVNPGDVIIRVTSTGICGLDLHLYEVLGPFTGEGDILGYEPMGVVQETGPEVKQVSPGGPGGARPWPGEGHGDPDSPAPWLPHDRHRSGPRP
jgi:D-arabinose 1-dehydrogenase-like Zn-dependent alcohol dehydrogenase